MKVGFNNSTQDLSPMRRCHRCTGSGHAPCQICFGRGVTTRRMDRFGKPVLDRCDGCLGRKTSRCSLCSGEGFI